MKMSNGEKYIGGWKNDKKHGFGFFVDESGVRRNGEWQNNLHIKWVEEESD